MAGGRFLVAEFPSLRSLAGQMTHRHPGSSTDTALDEVVDVGDEQSFTALGFLQGFPDAGLADFVAQSRNAGSSTRVLAQGPAGTLLHYAGRGPRRSDQPSSLLRRTGEEFLAPWMHVQAGHHTIRAEAEAGAASEAKVRRLRDWAAGVGLRCSIDLREVRGPQLRQWFVVPGLLQQVRSQARATVLA